MRSFYLNTFDSTPLSVRVWDETVAPRALVLVCHDVGLHSGSYDAYARYLNSRNFVVVAYDQRAFGASARPEALGMGQDGTFEGSVNDVNFVFRTFLREYSMPIFIVGHGYGGYVAASALQQGVISPAGVLLVSVGQLSASAVQTALAMALASPMRDKPATLRLPMLLAAEANAQQDATHPDPLCGVVPSARFGADICKGLLNLIRPENLNKLQRTVAYALFAGLQDAALGEEAHDAIQLLLTMRRMGFAPRFFGYETGGHNLLQNSDGYCFGHTVDFMQSVLESSAADA